MSLFKRWIIGLTLAAVVAGFAGVAASQTATATGDLPNLKSLGEALEQYHEQHAAWPVSLDKLADAKWVSPDLRYLAAIMDTPRPVVCAWQTLDDGAKGGDVLYTDGSVRRLESDELLLELSRSAEWLDHGGEGEIPLRAAPVREDWTGPAWRALTPLLWWGGIAMLVLVVCPWLGAWIYRRNYPSPRAFWRRVIVMLLASTMAAAVIFFVFFFFGARAREASQRSPDGRKVKAIVSAVCIYRAEHDEQLPHDLAQLVSAGLITPKMMVSDISPTPVGDKATVRDFAYIYRPLDEAVYDGSRPIVWTCGTLQRDRSGSHLGWASYSTGWVQPPQRVIAEVTKVTLWLNDQWLREATVQTQPATTPPNSKLVQHVEPMY